jgi:hypothetical protein
VPDDCVVSHFILFAQVQTKLSTHRVSSPVCSPRSALQAKQSRQPLETVPSGGMRPNSNTQGEGVTAMNQSLSGGVLILCMGVGFGGNLGVCQTREFIYLNGKMVAVEARISPAVADALTVTPGSGAATTQRFDFSYSHPTAANQFANVRGLIRESFAIDAGACQFSFTNASSPRILYLVKDDGYPVTPGLTADANGVFSGTTQSGQCQIDGSNSTVSSAGQVLTLSLTISFPTGSSFSNNGQPNKAIWMSADGVVPGWQPRGVWQIPTASPTIPFVSGSAPSAGQFSSVLATASFETPTPNGNWQTAWILINQALDGGNACYVGYSIAMNQFFLWKDTGPPTSSDFLSPGAVTTVQNSQCILRGAGSSATITPAGLTIVADIQFKPAFAGWRFAFQGATYLPTGSSNSISSLWQARAAWKIVP